MDSDCSVSSNSGKQVIVGICAMAKKSQSKPMKEILTRLQEFEYIKMVVFEEDVILKVISICLKRYLLRLKLFCCRNLLKTGQYVIAWSPFTQKVSH